jgi:hypothetical protein
VPVASIQPPPSTCTWTFETVTLLDALPWMETDPLTVAEFAGELIDTAGPLTTVVFETDTVVDVDDTLPDVSVARAAIVWVPLETEPVAQDVDHDDVPVAVCHAAPSIEVSTFASAVLSPALPATLTVPETDEPEDGEVMATVGAVVSATVLLTLTVTDLLTVLPAASAARAVRVCAPFETVAEFHPSDHDVVPEAALHAPPSTDTDTDTTPTLSELEPATLTWPATVADAAGDEMESVGAVVSVHDVLHAPPLVAADAVCVRAGATRPRIATVATIAAALRARGRRLVFVTLSRSVTL